MAFQVSPGVLVQERDLTNVIPAVATTIGAVAGQFSQGPMDEVTSISSEKELVETFGKPDSTTFEYFFSAASFLQYSSSLRVVRTANSGSKNAVVSGTALQIKNTDDLKQYIENKLTLRNESFIDWKEIVGSDYDPVRSELENLKQKYNNNLDIFMHFHKIRHTNLGVYESLLGQIDFYSIYVPFVWLNSLNWDFKYLENRNMLIKILKKL